MIIISVLLLSFPFLHLTSARATPKVIYGADDRQDYYERVNEFGVDDVFATIGRQSIVALVQRWTLGAADSNGLYNPSSSNLFDSQGLCSDQRFGEQRTDSFCSGTLVDSTHVVTAGHCLKTDSDCSDVRFVFNYYITGYNDGVPEYKDIRTSDVYSCADFVSVVSNDANGELDWAYVTLDREVPSSSGHVPIPMETERVPRTTNERIVMIGFPSGLPMKIEDGGRVGNTRSGTLDFFEASADAFGGNSGSGVFNSDGSKMIGILVRGQTDYISRGNCNVVNEVPEQGSGGEDITYSFHAYPECTQDSDCESGEICTGTTCTVPECVEDTDCANGQVCESNSCVGAVATAWFRMTGDCGVQGDNCVSSGNFPESHGNNEQCSITLVQDAYVTPSSVWDLETSYDQIFINGVNVERRQQVPSSLSMHDVITWSSDGSVTQGGWQLCFSDDEPEPECTVDGDCANNEICDTNRMCVPAPECVNDSDCDYGQTCESGTCVGTSEYYWFRIVGDCDVQQDNCVSSGNFPLAYGHNEDCTVTVLQDGFVTPSTVWNLEEGYDHIYINGDDVESTSQVPSSLAVGDTIRWTSDVSISHEGWQLCFTDTEPVPECVVDSDCSSGSICQDGACMQGYECEYFKMVGDCDTQNDNCVSSGNFPEVHGNSEQCIVTVLQESTITPSSIWELENDYDHVFINDVDVESRNNVPSTLSQDDVIRWESDFSVTNRGWQLCFSDAGGAVAPCPRWCGTNAQPWSEKCSQFDSCKVCSMCDTIETDTDEPTLEPTNRLLTAVPTLEPTTGERRNTGQCFGWCANNGNPWSVKCFEYLKCSGCKECEQFDNTTEEEPSFEPTFEPTVQSETDEPTFEPTVQSETDEPTLEPTVQNETDEPTFEPTVRGPCVAWCAKSGVPWESKCGWPKCLGCDECFEEPEEPEEPEDDGICENWCASSPVGWNQGKCRWGKCEGCAECKATLEPTVEPTLEPEDPATFSPTKEPTLEPEDPADSDDCTRCVELVKENHKCNKGVPMNGSPRVSSSDTCGPEALQQCITQSSKAECAEVYFSFRMDGENGACVYSSADECVTDSGIGVRTNHPWEIYTYNCCVEPEETTAKPTEEPEETRSCPGWCQAHGAPWSTKCTFNACKVCVRCT